MNDHFGKTGGSRGKIYYCRMIPRKMQRLKLVARRDILHSLVIINRVFWNEPSDLHNGLHRRAPEPDRPKFFDHGLITNKGSCFALITAILYIVFSYHRRYRSENYATSKSRKPHFPPDLFMSAPISTMILLSVFTYHAGIRGNRTIKTSPCFIPICESMKATLWDWFEKY